MSSSPTRVAIVGAGIGGLTLARILQLRKGPNISFTIYDSDASASVRASDGGSLDLRYESGQRALRHAGLHAEFMKLCRPVGQHLRVLDKTGKVYHEPTDPGADFYNPEIDRGQLRSLILDSLEPGTVQWGHKATAVHRDAATGTYIIEFASGAKAENVDVVVGADGAWSRVRPLAWPGANPIYSGITFFETKIDTAKFPQFMPLVGQGMMWALSDGKALMAQQNSNGIMRLYSATRDEKIELMLELFEGWDDALLELIRAGEAPAMRSIYALPWDAARGQLQTTSPFAGEGVNLAMADAADLADMLVSGGPLEKYEKLMRNRANECANESAMNLELFFKEDAANAVIAIFKKPWILEYTIKSYHYLRSFF
ncbi:monooxygenase [Mycena latifolia]|nr:monooxygenase [Mycena latifolia]